MKVKKGRQGKGTLNIRKTTLIAHPHHRDVYLMCVCVCVFSSKTYFLECLLICNTSIGRFRSDVK